MIKQYGRLLTWVLRHQGLTLLVAIGTLILTIWLYVIIPKGFFPVQDTGLIQGVTQAPQSTSYAAMVKRQGELAKKILQDDEVVNLSSFVGVDVSNTTLNSGRFLIGLKPHDERKLTSQEIVRRIEREAQGVEGIMLFLQPVQDLTTDTTVSATQYQFVLENANLDELNTWVPKLVSRLQNVPQITDLASDLEQSGLSANMLVIASGDGSELRRPLGVSIIGGLVISQILTLYTTPVIYLYLDRLRLWFQPRNGSRPWMAFRSITTFGRRRIARARKFRARVEHSKQ
jgi:multidrug efflux pump